MTHRWNAWEWLADRSGLVGRAASVSGQPFALFTDAPLDAGKRGVLARAAAWATIQPQTAADIEVAGLAFEE